MGTQTVTATTTGATQPIVLDLLKFQHGQGVGVVITVPSGASANYTVQVTGDNVQFGGGIPTNWNALDDCLVNANTSQNSNIAFPVTAVRLNVASLSAGGSITLAIIATDA